MQCIDILCARNYHYLCSSFRELCRSWGISILRFWNRGLGESDTPFMNIIDPFPRSLFVSRLVYTLSLPTITLFLGIHRSQCASYSYCILEVCLTSPTRSLELSSLNGMFFCSCFIRSLYFPASSLYVFMVVRQPISSDVFCCLHCF